MKYWVSLLFVVSMLFMTAGLASAATTVPKLVLDGKELKPEEPPALIGSRVMLPVRIVGENLGYIVDYEKTKKTVTVKNGATTIVMTVGSKSATVDGKKVAIDAPPTVTKTGRTLVPLRFINDNFGATVYWDNAAKTAFIYSAAGNNGGTGGGDAGGGTGNGGTGGDGSDGGLIGVVDPEEGGDPTDGGTPPPATETPASSLIHSVRFDADAIVLKYDGTVAPKTSVLSGPDRIVVDLPGTDFASDFDPALPADPLLGKTGELAVSGHAALQKIRYSLYADNPKTLRFVLDLSQKWNFEVQNDPTAGEVKIVLMQPDQQPQQPDKGVYTVVLDAGHGGSDPGAISVAGKSEKTFNLAVILKLQALLAGDSRLNIVMTRSGDTYPTLADRYNLANSIGADLFLSVHANSNPKNTIKGTEVYYSRDASLAFANVVHQYATTAGGLQDRGVLKKSLAVTRETVMPAVLFEAGYLSNADEEKVLFTEDFQNRIAAGLAQAIKAYLNLA
ncbi:N-acetylmuramoyl-L-alanine amidase family protein [Cohnella sp. REN36]|uniref:N-acetylmuramoyl-L-alanine amidase family protein n=1 Tax=Cohnella sp. REN36 TaxID=2887347 RepID=UPI001D13A185|nr:N-acetylmuramoyl-L-alanine amidase family protein [Cohnella sp. REN36]MCC3376455.1 N-acetylmuramoyl-L-alanine amidase family protein [Cohnella sp. REN36]